MDTRLFTYSEDEVRDLVLKIHPRIVPYINSLLSRGGQQCSASNNAEDIFYDVLCAFLDKRVEISSDKVPAYLVKAVKNKRNYIDKTDINQSIGILDEHIPESKGKLT